MSTHTRTELNSSILHARRVCSLTTRRSCRGRKSPRDFIPKPSHLLFVKNLFWSGVKLGRTGGPTFTLTLQPRANVREGEVCCFLWTHARLRTQGLKDSRSRAIEQSRTVRAWHLMLGAASNRLRVRTRQSRNVFENGSYCPNECPSRSSNLLNHFNARVLECLSAISSRKRSKLGLN